MKKISVLAAILFLILSTTAVFANGGNGAGGGSGAGNEGNDAGQGNLIQNLIQNNEREMHQERTMVTGLPNAMLRFKNEEQKQHIEQVMSKISDHRKEILNKLVELHFEETTDSEGNTAVVAEGKKPAKLFGFIKMQKMYRYQIMSNGDVYQLQKGIFDFLFKDEPEAE